MKRVLTLLMCSLSLATLGATYEEHAVAAVLMGEAWGEGQRGMIAVAEVIHQRSVDMKKTPLQVVAAHRGKVHAFSCMNGQTPDSLIHKFSGKADFQVALNLATIACRQPARLPGVTKAANHFIVATEHPYWTEGERPVAVIGQHAFYKLDLASAGY